MVYHTVLGKFQPAFPISGPGDGFKKRNAFLIIHVVDREAALNDHARDGAPRQLQDGRRLCAAGRAAARRTAPGRLAPRLVRTRIVSAITLLPKTLRRPHHARAQRLGRLHPLPAAEPRRAGH